MKITILGCGSSVGVPSIGCKCSVCLSGVEKNKRLRTSALLEFESSSILIDATPDLRFQMLSNGVSQIDSVLFTHSHADHCNGIGELVAFQPKCQQRFLPIYGSFSTLCSLISANAYLFIPNIASTPWNKCYYLAANALQDYEQYLLSGVKVFTLTQNHGRINSLGFIFNDSFAYCTDVKSFPEKSWESLASKQLEVLVLGCLMYNESPAHAHFDLCLQWIDALKPKIAVLTHMSHYIDYLDVTARLDKIGGYTKVMAAYDGMVIECS